MGTEGFVRDFVRDNSRPWRGKLRKTRKENRENSSRMEAHEVAPDVVDVAPADVIKVKFTQIVQRGGYQLLNGRSQLQSCVCRRIKDVL